MNEHPAARDLLTILYRPRETMRRILDVRDRWTVQIVLLAFFCASVSDSDARHLGDVLPDLHPLILGIIAVLALLAVSVTWVLALFVLSWLALVVGRMLGGAAVSADLRAAAAWGLVPVIWSAILRIPIAVYQSHLNIAPRMQGREALFNFIAQGGCAFAVAVLAMQILLFGWWLFITSSTVAEAQGFSTVKGLANVALTIVGPLLIVGAAVFAFHNR